MVGDKGYHSSQALVDLEAVSVRRYIAEPDRGRRNWTKNPTPRDAVYRNRRRICGARGLRLLRLRGERLERPFAHLYETGGMRPSAPARPQEHSKATTDPHGRHQARTAHAEANGRRHPARVAGPADRGHDGTSAVGPRSLGDSNGSRTVRATRSTNRAPCQHRMSRRPGRRPRNGFHHGLRVA